MTDQDTLIIFGAGGFGREVAWLARQALPGSGLTFVVDLPQHAHGPVDGVDVELLEVTPPGRPYVVAIGDPHARRSAVGLCDGAGLRAATLVHPAIDLSGRNDLGEGSVLCTGTVITTGVRIGRHVHVNLNCTIGHDTVIGDFTTISPGANISGNVLLEEGVYIGTGASIINGTSGAPLRIGAGAVVAAGACVTKPVEAGALVAGVPAVRKR